MIARPTEKQLPNHGACEGNSRDILLSGVPSVCGAVQTLEDGIDLANDPEGLVRKGSRVQLGW